MKDLVLIKSFPNGITIHLDPETPFEEILREIAYKFSEARTFFGRASVALSIEGREVTDPEEIRILDAIHANSDLVIICIVGRDEATNKNFIKALAHMEKKLSGGEDGQFFKGEQHYRAGGRLSRKRRDQRQECDHPRRPVRRGIRRGERPGRGLCGSA